MKHIFIVDKESKRYIRAIKDIADRYELDYVIEVRKSREELIEVAKSYALPNNILYAVSTDSTLNAVLNGVVGTNAFLGLIPGSNMYDKISKTDRLLTRYDVKKVNDMYALGDIVITPGMRKSKTNIGLSSRFNDLELSNVTKTVVVNNHASIMDYIFIESDSPMDIKEYHGTEFIVEGANQLKMQVDGITEVDTKFSIDTRSNTVQLADNHQITRILTKDL